MLAPAPGADQHNPCELERHRSHRSTSTQRAREGYGSSDELHGAFTDALLEAPREGKAELPQPNTGRPDGVVDTQELARWVDEMVPVYSWLKWKQEQFPMESTSGQSFPIAVVGAGAAVGATGR